MVASAIGAVLVGICALLGSWFYLFNGITIPIPSLIPQNKSLLSFNKSIPLINEGMEVPLEKKVPYSALKAEFTDNFGLPLSEAVTPPKPIETILSNDNLDQLLTGKWIVLVYAEWCHNSHQLLRIFNEFLAVADKLMPQQREKLPNLAKITVGQLPRLATAAFIDKIPTLLLIENGRIRVTKNIHHSSGALLDLSLADWKDKTMNYSIKLDLSRVSFYDEWSIEAFDYFGKYAFPLQEKIIKWINDNKQSAYALLITSISSLFVLRRLGIIKLLTR